MDIATLLGIGVGLLMIAATSLLGTGGSSFIHFPSMMIVFGGTMAATFVNFPLGDVLKVMKVAQKALFSKEPNPEGLIEKLVQLAEQARREGILAIERHIDNLDDEFMKNGIQLAVDGSEPEVMRNIMENELYNLQNRHKLGQSIFTAMGTFAPAFGMIGTLIGLIKMLRTLEDPTQIGAGMAVALVTTFYGAVIANLIFLPIAGKLKTRSEKEVLEKELIIEGILSIQSGDNPRIIRGKLMTFLSPQARKQD
jgi:chemotaxis protein MotA